MGGDQKEQAQTALLNAKERPKHNQCYLFEIKSMVKAPSNNLTHIDHDVNSGKLVQNQTTSQHNDLSRAQHNQVMNSAVDIMLQVSHKSQADDKCWGILSIRPQISSAWDAAAAELMGHRDWLKMCVG